MEPHDRHTTAHRSVEPAELPELCNPKDQRDNEYRSRILAAARALFDRNGFETVNMYQIAQEAGIGQGTLYRRYEHLGEIYSDLLRTSIEQFLEELEDGGWLDSSSLPALDRLSRVLSRMVDYIDDKAELLSAMSRLYSSSKKSVLPQQRPLTARIFRILEQLLDTAHRQNEIREIDVKLTTNFLFAAVDPHQYFYHRDVLGYSKEQYLVGIGRIFIDGLQIR